MSNNKKLKIEELRTIIKEEVEKFYKPLSSNKAKSIKEFIIIENSNLKEMHATDIVGWTDAWGSAYCLEHEPEIEQEHKHPIFASDEGWEDMSCDECHRTLADVAGIDEAHHMSEDDKKENMPSDYEQCGECGFDHSYEYPEASKWHKEHDKEQGKFSAKMKDASNGHHISEDDNGDEVDVSRDEIIEAMARAMWVSEWASEMEERGTSFSGMDLMDVAPPTPSEAVQLAVELASDIESDNGMSLSELYSKAVNAPGRHYSEPDPSSFGHDLAMQAMGHGVSWSDNHPRFGMKKLPLIEPYQLRDLVIDEVDNPSA